MLNFSQLRFLHSLESLFKNKGINYIILFIFFSFRSQNFEGPGVLVSPSTKKKAGDMSPIPRKENQSPWHGRYKACTIYLIVYTFHSSPTS